MTYTSPVRDIRFTLENVVGLSRIAPAFPDLSDDLLSALLDGAGQLMSDEIAPLNAKGDTARLQLEGVDVRTPEGFAEAYGHWVEGGWGGLASSVDFGGQGLPLTLGFAVSEMFTGANMAFSLCSMLTQGTVELLSAHGSKEQKRLFLPKLVSGEWTGTMNLTEPQAGSDVGALATKAEPAGDDTYRITGTKIFITWGEHDLTDNIIHMVLARLPDAPAGSRGISLFLVPKFLVNPDGSLGPRNDVKCVRLEEKLGIHASPTCVMSYGEEKGAIGYLVGEENRGLTCMFTMMNNARLHVGLEGVGIADRAYQQALAYAQERRQGKPFGQQHPQSDMVPIIEHADVRRMLMTMKAHTEAARAVCYATGIALDEVRIADDNAGRTRAQARADLLTPIAKAWSTDIGVDMASMGVQIHGGMGFIEETGAAQHYRDARIAPIYEGTNGIQAIDLVTRKLPLDGGQVVADYLAEITETVDALNAATMPELQTMGGPLKAGCSALEEAGQWLAKQLGENAQDALAGATDYLRLFGIVAGGHYLSHGALKAAEYLDQNDDPFYRAKIEIARFYAQTVLPLAPGLGASATAGAAPLFAVEPEELGP